MYKPDNNLWSISKYQKFVFQSEKEGLFSLCFFVNSSAFLMNFFLSFKNSSANSVRRGCSGSGSLTKATNACITETKIFSLAS